MKAKIAFRQYTLAEDVAVAEKVMSVQRIKPQYTSEPTVLEEFETEEAAHDHFDDLIIMLDASEFPDSGDDQYALQLLVIHPDVEEPLIRREMYINYENVKKANDGKL